MSPDDDAKPKRPPAEEPPDGRGKRPTDPNELAKSIVDQATDDEASQAEDPGRKEAAPPKSAQQRPNEI